MDRTDGRIDRADGRMGERTDGMRDIRGRTDKGRMDEWKDGHRRDERRNGRTDERMDGRMDGLRDGRTNGQTGERRTDGRMHRTNGQMGARTARTFKCCFDNCKVSFYRSFNAIYGRLGRCASPEVIVHLLSSKCMPVLLYGLDTCSANDIAS